MLPFALGHLLRIADYSLSWKMILFPDPFPVKLLWAEFAHIILHQPADLCFCGIYLVKGSSEASTLWGDSQLRIRHLMHWKSLIMTNFSSFYCLLQTSPAHNENTSLWDPRDYRAPGARQTWRTGTKFSKELKKLMNVLGNWNGLN